MLHVCKKIIPSQVKKYTSRIPGVKHMQNPKTSEIVYKMAERKAKFTFHIAQNKKFSSLEDKDNKELLTKWLNIFFCIN